MVVPRFKIGQTVYVYKYGKLKEQVIDMVRTEETDSHTTVAYRFKNQERLLMDFLTGENEVFASIEDFKERVV